MGVWITYLFLPIFFFFAMAVHFFFKNSLQPLSPLKWRQFFFFFPFNLPLLWNDWTSKCFFSSIHIFVQSGWKIVLFYSNPHFLKVNIFIKKINISRLERLDNYVFLFKKQLSIKF